MKHTYLLIAALPSTPLLLLNVPEVTTEKKFDDNCTTSYVSNSVVTKPNLTKFVKDVQK